MELAEALKAVLRDHAGLVDDKVSLLHCNWIAVTSRAEEWLNLLLVRQAVKICSLRARKSEMVSLQTFYGSLE